MPAIFFCTSSAYLLEPNSIIVMYLIHNHFHILMSKQCLASSRQKKAYLKVLNTWISQCEITAKKWVRDLYSKIEEQLYMEELVKGKS